MRGHGSRFNPAGRLPPEARLATRRAGGYDGPGPSSLVGVVSAVKTTARLLLPPWPCAYLPEQTCRMEYLRAQRMSADEYSARLLAGWRRFGRWVFRPCCPACSACRSLRVDAAAFRPDRSQRRNRRANEREVILTVGEPSLSAERLDLYHRFHAERCASRGWADREEDPASYADSFLDNPFPTEEWRYELGGRLVGLGYVDALPVGLSAIYFVRDPAQHARGLGTWNILRMIEEARRRGLPHVYLGYCVEGCRSLEYKARFRPHEILGPDHQWRGA
jgi:arginyl-tRNA--protein-N-Asp/Glu arginylyltransferase